MCRRKRGAKRRGRAETVGGDGHGVRASRSLSALSQRHNFVRTSNSSENLHRVSLACAVGNSQQKQFFAQLGLRRPSGPSADDGTSSCHGCRKGGFVEGHQSPPTSARTKAKRLLFFGRDNAASTAGAEGESGYSSGSSSRRKKSLGRFTPSGAASSAFFHQTLHIRRKGSKDAGAQQLSENDGGGKGTLRGGEGEDGRHFLCLCLKPTQIASIQPNRPKAVQIRSNPSTSSDASSNPGDFRSEAQKKRWWMLHSHQNNRPNSSSSVRYIDENVAENGTPLTNSAQLVPDDGGGRRRRPSAPAESAIVANALKGRSATIFPGQHYLISPPKRTLGQKRTESAFAALLSPKDAPFPSLFPMSVSWSVQNGQGPPPPPAPTDETARCSSPHHHNGNNNKHSSATNRFVNALLTMNGRWRTSTGGAAGEEADAGRRREHKTKAYKGNSSSRSRSVGANQQMRLSATMHSIGQPMDDVLLAERASSGALRAPSPFSTYFRAFGFARHNTLSVAGEYSSPFSLPPNDPPGNPSQQSPFSTNSMASPSRKIDGLEMFKRLENENRLDGSIVALKEIRLQEQEGLPFTAIREISLLRALRHANIVRLHQIIIQQARALVLVFEYMRTDLAKYMEQYPHGLDTFRTKLFLFQLLRGLAFCHEQKILHRDLKPQNLLVNTNGELKLADFGLFWCSISDLIEHNFMYRPPDVLLGSTVYSTPLDIWGVGCIFAEMCIGCALFPGASDALDQLDRIFAVRGTPSAQHWPEALQLPKWDQFQLDAYAELEWADVDIKLVFKLNDHGRDLLTQLLKLPPRERISAAGAMLHKYFDELPKTLHALLPTESVLIAFNGNKKLSALAADDDRRTCYV
ncbi:hypothetical protein GPALN_006150 [Globodera pallida]|nr:hypothetical protein GPALN_006150 [Globodera pallida]